MEKPVIVNGRVTQKVSGIYHVKLTNFRWLFWKLFFKMESVEAEIKRVLTTIVEANQFLYHGGQLRRHKSVPSSEGVVTGNICVQYKVQPLGDNSVT